MCRKERQKLQNLSPLQKRKENLPCLSNTLEVSKYIGFIIYIFVINDLFFLDIID